MSIDIRNELHQNFLDYSYEANSERAFADARDGLKPGQRACLWEMYSKGYSSNKPHVKSAKISGGVISSWWPHGDVAIYETFARMSQPWINNIPEVDWHGNNGNIVIGNEPASARYTEARLSKAIEQGMFEGIKKNVVPMQPNFSEDNEWPEVLPAIFPRLLINGCQGIGVTIANVWAPMNLKEIIDAIETYITTGTLDTSKAYFDFPTGGIIINEKDLHTIHETGKGKILLRAKTEIKGKSIFIREFPYQVFIEPWIDNIKELITKEEITGIDEIYNKTDKKGLLVEVICSEDPDTVLNKLFKLTDLQKSISPNQWALVGKTPKLLNLKQYFDIYIDHNLKCIRKEYEFDLQKAEARLEIVEGLLKALVNIDDIIALIKASDSSKHAVTRLIETYGFTEAQAKAIVGLKLGTLARLESIELNDEKMELQKTIEHCNYVLSNSTEASKVFLTRLKDFGNKFGFARKTELANIIIPKEEKEKPVIVPENCVVVMTESGTIKRIPSANFKTQGRNTKGVKTQDDITSSVIRTNTVDNLMVFSDKGLMYRILVNNIPVGTNISRGVSVKTLTPMDVNEKPATMYSIYKDTKAQYVLFVTTNGLVKKTALSEYIDTKKKSGIGAIKLKEGDSLSAVTLVNDEDIILITEKGYMIKFNTTEVSATGRLTSGVKGINLTEGDKVVAALPIHDANDDLAIFIKDGYGKRIDKSEITIQKRGGRGVLCYKGSSQVVAAQLVNENDNLLIIGDRSSIVLKASDLTVQGRTTTGIAVIKGNQIKTVSKV